MESIRLNNDLRSIPELRKRLRKFRWFVSAFKVHTSLVEQEIGKEFLIDEDRLSNVFFSWVVSVDNSRDGSDIDLKDFITYAAGLALASLIHHAPVKRSGTPDSEPAIDANTTSTEGTKQSHDIWPEGYLYANFCFSVIAALEEQEFGKVISYLHDDAKNSVFWGSFLENTIQESRLAIPYLDKMLGNLPNWELPMTMLERPAMQAAVNASSSQ